MTKPLRNPELTFMYPVDRFLLLHFPMVWKSRLHYVLFYAVIVDFLVFLLAHVVPLRLHYVKYWHTAAGVLLSGAMVALFSWFLAQSRFSIEQQFGRTSGALANWKFIGYTVGFIIILSAPVVFTRSISARVSSIVSLEELTRDYDVLAPAFSVTGEVGSDNAHAVPAQVIRKYTARRIENELSPVDADKTALSQARNNIVALADLLGKRIDWTGNRRSRPPRFSIFSLMMFFSTCFAMVLLLFDYLGDDALPSITIVGMLCTIPVFIASSPDLLKPVQAFGYVASGALVSLVVSLMASRRYIQHATSVHPFAKLSIGTLCLSFPLFLQSTVLFLAELGWIEREARLFFAALTLPFLLVFIHLVHRWLIMVISLPER